MVFKGKSKEVGQQIIERFKSGDVAEPISKIFLKFNGDSPMGTWSSSNRFICALSNCTDARGFNQWKEVGRYVKKNSHASAFIMFPLKRKAEPKDGEEEGGSYIYGFGTSPVFDISATSGEDVDSPEQRFLEGRPLAEVAKAWGIELMTHDAEVSSSLGVYYGWQKVISLGVEDLGTWFHELIHAAEDRNGNLNDRGYARWKSETVAELGSATLAHMLDIQLPTSGNTWHYIQRYADEANIEPIKACCEMLDRVCAAIELILDTAESIEALDHDKGYCS